MKKAFYFAATLLTCAALFTSCSHVSRDTSFVEAIGQGELGLYAAHPKLRALWHEGQADVPADLWPASFSNQRVLAVKIYMEGVKIVLARNESSEEGIFVDSSADEAPESGSGIEFNPLASQVYSYTEKNRTPYFRAPKPREK